MRVAIAGHRLAANRHLRRGRQSMPEIRSDALLRALTVTFLITSFARRALSQEAEPESVPSAIAPSEGEGATEQVPAAPAAAAPSAPAKPVPVPSSQASVTTVSGPPVVAKDEGWKFEFHGYLRAPMMVGLGHRDNPGPGQSPTTFHSPIIPDGQYLSWQSTPHNKSDWAELYLSIGNSFARGTVSLQGYNFYQGSF